MNLNIDADADAEDLTRYQLKSRREILSLLRNVAMHNQLIRMQANNGVDSVLTSILEVDGDTDTVIIDCASIALLNQRLLESKDIAFDTALDNIRILFRTPSVEHCIYDNRPAFRIALPDSVIRLQRREFYRVKTPVANPVHCTLTIRGEKEETITVVAPLYNISGGGISIIDEKKQIDADFGRIYPDCCIDFPGSHAVVSLRVRSAQHFTLANGKRIHRLGFEYVNPSPAATTAIQRYITKLQRDQNARETGLA